MYFQLNWFYLSWFKRVLKYDFNEVIWNNNFNDDKVVRVDAHMVLEVVEHILEEEADSMEVVELDIQVVEDHVGLEVVDLAFLVDNRMVDILTLYKIKK